MTLNEPQPPLLIGISWPGKITQARGQNPARLLIASLLLVFVSACAEPTLEVSIDDSHKQEISSQSSIYGRNASFSYPAFSGQYQVATHSEVFIDYSRIETFDPDSIEKRQLQVRFFYPSNSPVNDNATAKLPVINKVSWQYLVGHHEIAGKRLRYRNYEQAFWDITINEPISQEQTNYPVLIFSHGYGYNTESYSALLGELASKGYIIVAINHSYGANPSDLSGAIDLTDPIIVNSNYASANKNSNHQLASSHRFIWAEKFKHNAIEQYLPIWSGDQSFIIEQLIRLNSDANSKFYQKLDLANLGLFGHSYGGAAAYHTASNDSRIKAVIDLDGTVFNHNRDPLLQPFAFIVSSQHQPKFNFEDVQNRKYFIRLNQFSHASFTDHILWWQWDHDDSITELGDVEALRAVELTSELIDDFFANHMLLRPARWFSEEQASTEEFSITRM
jgi:pimeloyl-ACP methyl ester carboxylesterase